MSAHTNPLEDYCSIEGIEEAWELVKTGLIVVQGTMYKLELWHSFSNPDIQYYVSIHVLQGDAWKRMPDQPFPTAPNADAAFRAAMALIVDRKNAA